MRAPDLGSDYRTAKEVGLKRTLQLTGWLLDEVGTMIYGFNTGPTTGMNKVEDPFLS